MKILLADDDPHIHLIMKMWFEKKGHAVETALNGQDALDRLKTRTYDILVTDINMPLLNGIELVQKTLDLERRPALIVLLTSRCDHLKLKKRLPASGVHFCNKPFSPAHLSDLIEKLSAPQTAPS